MEYSLLLIEYLSIRRNHSHFMVKLIETTIVSVTEIPSKSLLIQIHSIESGWYDHFLVHQTYLLY